MKAKRHAKKKLQFKAPVGLFVADVNKLSSIEPVTHVFAFLGYSGIVEDTVQLAARSSTCTTLVAIVLYVDELKKSGLLEDGEDDFEVIPNISMPSGNQYTGVVVPMTASRRERLVNKACKPKKDDGGLIQSIVDLSAEEDGMDRLYDMAEKSVPSKRTRSSRRKVKGTKD